MSEPGDFSAQRNSAQHDNPENVFLRAATPELLEDNYERWVHFFDERMKKTRSLATIKRNQDEHTAIDTERLAEAREVVSQIQLTHVVGGRNLGDIVRVGYIQSKAELERQGIKPHEPGNTYELDYIRGLHDFVFLRFSMEPFRIFGITDAIKLVFDHELLNEQNVFASFEDIVEYSLRRTYMGQADEWETYLAENFSGRRFPEVATRYIAASYAHPQSYLTGQRPDFVSRKTGAEEFSQRPLKIPEFEVKIYQRIPVSLVREIHLNTDGKRGVATVQELGLSSLIKHDDGMVAW